MSNFVKSRDQLIKFFKGEMIGPLDYSSTHIDEGNVQKYDLDDNLTFETFKEASLPAIQKNGDEILNLVSFMSDEQPTQRYGVGVLYPYNVVNNENNTEIPNEDISNEDTVGDDNAVISDLAIDKKVKENLNKQNTKNSRKKTKGDFSESVSDIRSSNTLKQSSMGISFFVDLPKNSMIKVFNHEGLECGSYIKKEVTINDNTSDRSHYWWFRNSINLDFTFSSDKILNSKEDQEFLSENGSIKFNDLEIECKLISRQINNSNLKLITIFLVNRSKLLGSNEEICLFQSNFHISIQNNKGENISCIHPYPESSVIGDNENKDQRDIEEDESIDLIFRNKKTYAIGHGCSADWKNIKDQELVYEISSNHFPTYEAANVTPDIILDDGSLFVLPMSILAGLKNETSGTILNLLNQLPENYSNWIEKNRSFLLTLDKKYHEVAKTNNLKCEEMLKRIQLGINFLKEDKNALEAFKFANYAILSQQIRTKRYKDDDREWIIGSDGRKKPKIEYTEPDLIKKESRIGNWRPFQMAFILSSLQSTVLDKDQFRDMVELIFFPTGGGKTEAYLGLIAFLGFYKRLTNKNHHGVDVIMRYTLRLLTTQQFTRAASLICAMEKLRLDNTTRLGDNEFSIGVWLGQATTPNRKQKAKAIVKQLLKDNVDDQDEDPFLLTKCPWCSAGMGLVQVKNNHTKRSFPRTELIGIEEAEDTIKFRCGDIKCHYNNHWLPIYVIDDDVYDKKPTILIATVDKFAQVAWMPEAKSIFGLDKEGARVNDPPSLILQDELHLITGPLGSMFGLYETLIEDLCTDKRDSKNSKPKIICSTATIKRYAKQVESLFNRKNCSLFPPLGLTIEDNFFGKYKYNEKNELDNPKKFIGIHASSIGSTQSAQVRVYASLLQSVMFMDEEDRDPWFTLMNFFGSIRELATTLTLLETDIPDRIGVFFKRFSLTVDQIRKLGKNGNETLELTSRLKNQEIPKAINKLEKSSSSKGCVDVCLASNIIEVGVDIDRLSLLTIFGQPKTTSSYIQVSGRIGRNWFERPGLVITIYGPMRPRDKSHFEKFKSYHQRLYAQVEPTSVTPFSKPALERALHALMVGYVRMNGNSQQGEYPIPYPKDLLDEFYNIIKERVKSISNDSEEIDTFNKIFSGKKIDWEGWKRAVYSFRSQDSSNPLIYSSGSFVPNEITRAAWATPTSLRSVDSECMTYVTDNYAIAHTQEKKNQLND